MRSVRFHLRSLMRHFKTLAIGVALCALAFHAVAHAETPEEIFAEGTLLLYRLKAFATNLFQG